MMGYDFNMNAVLRNIDDEIANSFHAIGTPSIEVDVLAGLDMSPVVSRSISNIDKLKEKAESLMSDMKELGIPEEALDFGGVLNDIEEAKKNIESASVRLELDAKEIRLNAEEMLSMDEQSSQQSHVKDRFNNHLEKLKQLEGV